MSYRALQDRHLDELLRDRAKLAPDERRQVRAVATVFPFRTNQYVVDELIDWSAVPDDPIYQLTFPQPGMLSPGDLAEWRSWSATRRHPELLNATVAEIRCAANPHPAGQADQNTPILTGRPIEGFQHKYAETLLVFPRQGQTCHAYCTYCFRWPQFVKDPVLKMATDDIEAMHGVPALPPGDHQCPDHRRGRADHAHRGAA